MSVGNGITVLACVGGSVTCLLGGFTDAAVCLFAAAGVAVIVGWNQ